MSTESVDVSQFEELRPLGKFEQFSSARHHLGFYNNVGITATYTLLSSHCLSLKDTIFAALAAVIRKHPILSTIPMDEDSANPYFALLPSIKLERTVTFTTRFAHPNETDSEMDAILEKQHNTNFKANFGSLPFWRLIIITQPERDNVFTAAFIFHHALGDGTSGLVFQKDFHAFLSSAPSLTSTTIIPEKRDLLPNLELLHPLPVPSPKSINSQEDLWTGAPITLPMTSHLRTLTLSPSTTASLISTCRANGATLTSTLPPIIASVLSQHIPPHFKTLECTIPVSLRRFLPYPVTEHVMGVWIDAFSSYFPTSTETFSWEEARRCKDNIKRYLEKGDVNVGKFKGVGNMRSLFLERIGKERGSSFEVSNLGSISIGAAEGRWEMGRVVFSRSAFASGSAFSVGVVSGPDGCAVLAFVWQDGIVSEEVMEGVVEGVRKVIGLLLDTKSGTNHYGF